MLVSVQCAAAGCRFGRAGTEVQGGNGQTEVEGGIALAEGDDGPFGLGDGLHVGPDLKGG